MPDPKCNELTVVTGVAPEFTHRRPPDEAETREQERATQQMRREKRRRIASPRNIAQKPSKPRG